MMGAYFAATFVAWTGSFVLGIVLALGANAAARRCARIRGAAASLWRDHLDQVLATFGLICSSTTRCG